MNTDKNIFKKKISKILCVILAALLVFFVIMAIRASFASKDIDKNVSQLEKEEDRSTNDAEKSIADIEKKEKSKTSLKSLAKVDFRTLFSGCVIAGDSIVEALPFYDIVDKDIAVYTRGASITSHTDIFSRTVSLKPHTIFLSFGLNDLEAYNGKAKPFVEAYKTYIKKLRKALPGVRICINSVLPATKAKISRVPALGHYGEFNTALIDMCKKEKITFIDHTAIVNEHPNWFEPDGQHFIKDFYPMWMANMAKEAGL